MDTANQQNIDMNSALEAMSLGRVVLTANRRLSLEIKGQYDRLHAGQGQLAWESANTVSWTDWMHSMFQELIDYGFTDQTLLNPHQACMLWEQIIQQPSHDQEILTPSSAARMANDAWALIQAWNIPTLHLTEYANDETELFLSWVEKFNKRCKQDNWLDSALIPNLVIKGLREGGLTTPNKIILAGFDEITPQQNEVLDLLHKKGCEISFLVPAQIIGSAHRFQAIDTTQEIHTAARWAIRRLQQNSNARIGVVVPQLATIRTQIEAIFSRSFNPVSILPGGNNSQKAYNISLGTPLNQCPPIADAFLILRFAAGKLSSGDLSRLLRSPFLAGSAVERERRARLDALIRRSVGERSISLDTLIRKAKEKSNIADDACPVLFNNLDAFRKRLDHLPIKLSPQKWTEEFQIILNIFGWCGFEGMNSTEYQQVERFNKAVVSFQQLGQVQHSMGLQEAIGRLQTIAAETLFQPQGSEAQVQVVGILEAAGLNFDHLWVIGLSDNKWPETAAPNPLLPISMQRDLGMPHASPRRELEYATAITERLLAGAPEVIVSNPESDGTNQLRVSPLVSGLSPISIDDLDLAQLADIHRLGFGSAKLEEIIDTKGPTLQAGSHLKGGSRLLSDQSACPFRAFANHRLGARPIEEPVSGADAKIRGIMVHRILQELWEQIRSHDKLLNMDDSELMQLVSAEVAKELSRIKPIRPLTFAPRFIEIEQERLTDLILEWLELERLRAPFTIASLEQKETVGLGGLQLDLVADRIDRLDDGRQVIIDYKTGKQLSYRGWFEQRIEEPQLPLYATTNESDVAGVFLAGVNRANLGFKGVTDKPELVPEIKAFSDTKESADYAGWDDLKAAWKQRLELLAEEILAGRADVMPKDRNKDCGYCPLPSLCRIHEQREIDAGEGEA